MAYRPVIPRLLAGSREVAETGCRLFERQQDRAGYGYLMLDGRRTRAHRAAWIAAHGPIPRGMLICHRCDTPACINIDHLFLGTPLDNMRDMIAKGRDRKDPRRGEQNGRAKLTKDKAAAIRADRRGKDAVAADYDISPAQVTRIRAGLQWKQYEEPWS